MITTWTIAYRRRTANRLLRADNFAGTWDEAAELGRRFGLRHPELDVWYVPTAESEKTRTYPEDRNNVLIPSTNRRVPIREGGAVDEDLLSVAQPDTPAADREVTREAAKDGIDLALDIHRKRWED